MFELKLITSWRTLYIMLNAFVIKGPLDRNFLVFPCRIGYLVGGNCSLDGLHGWTSSYAQG